MLIKNEYEDGEDEVLDDMNEENEEEEDEALKFQKFSLAHLKTIFGIYLALMFFSLLVLIGEICVTKAIFKNRLVSFTARRMSTKSRKLMETIKTRLKQN